MLNKHLFSALHVLIGNKLQMDKIYLSQSQKGPEVR